MHKIKQTSVLPILVILVAVPLAAASPGNYPLHDAIRNSDLDRLTGLLQAGHDPDQADELGRTAPHCALARPHGRGYLYVSELLRFGADPNIGDSIGATALLHAATNGFPAIATLLLENGADPNLALDGGLSPLSSASITGHMDIARLLEHQGARLPSEAKRLQLLSLGVINAAVRRSAKQQVAGESLQRTQARIA